MLFQKHMQTPLPWRDQSLVAMFSPGTNIMSLQARGFTKQVKSTTEKIKSLAKSCGALIVLKGIV